jgi:hypothetical protein
LGRQEGAGRGREGEVYFPCSRHRALIVFVVSAVVTFANIGFHPDFVRRWLSAFSIGWPVAAVIALLAFPALRRVTNGLVNFIEGK